MAKYVCDVCGWIYDPAVGDPDSGIEPGTDICKIFQMIGFVLYVVWVKTISL